MVPAIIISLLHRVEDALATPGFFYKRPSYVRVSSTSDSSSLSFRPVEQPPEGKHWIHEVKHDGYRCQVLVERGKRGSSP